MKIFIACSKWCYKYIPEIKRRLEYLGHEVILPNYYDDPMIEEKIKKLSVDEHKKFCEESFKISRLKANESDCILVLNMDKICDNNVYYNYIGGATLLEMYDSYILGHPIYLYNSIPNNMLRDEIEGMSPIILMGNLNKIGDINEKNKIKKRI